MTLTSCMMTSPIGALKLVADAEALVEISFETDDRAADDRAADDPGLEPAQATEHPVLVRAIEQLEEYFEGHRTKFDLPLRPQGTTFQHQVWEILTTIPYASTISYGEQAERIGNRRASRAVGAANGRNPLPIVIPCHRVIASTGALTGFAGGLSIKAWLLDHERAVAANRPDH